MKILKIFRGSPSSGKSFLANALVRYHTNRGEIVSGPHEADDYMIDGQGNYDFRPENLGFCHKRCFDDCETGMKYKNDIIIQSNTNTRKWEYQKYLDLAKKYGYEVQEIIV